MATSGSTDFKSNRLTIIKEAYEHCRVIDPSEPLTDAQVDSAAQTLNMMLKRFQTFGMQLWAMKRGAVTLTQSTQSYTCGTGGTGLTERPLRIVEAFYREGTDDTPLQIISREEYWGLGDKSTEGIPNEVYYDPQLTTGVLYIFNPADANAAGNTIELVYHRPFEDMDTDVDDFDFPNEWEEVISYGLAVRLGSKNGLITQRLNQLRIDFRDALEQVRGWDTEDAAVYMQPQFDR